jgi:hypothetical protein
MLPKGFRNNINIQPHKTGFPRRQEILDGIADKDVLLNQFLKKMDQAFVDL